MTSCIFVVLAASLSAAADGPPLDLEPPSPWELGVAVGGGWDSNALGAAASIASGFGSGRAWVARRFEASDADDVWLQLHYDGARYDSTREVDLDRPELGIEWAHAFGRVTGRVLGRAHGLGADLVQRLPRSLFLQAGYGIAIERVAGASYVAHSVLAEVGWRR